MFNKVEPLQYSKGVSGGSRGDTAAPGGWRRQREHPPVALSVPAALLLVADSRLPGCNERV